MIETHQLEKKFGSVLAIQSLELNIQPGEIVGLLGPNGAGKTTTLRLLTGMIQPTSGSAKIAGYDVVSDPVEVKKRVGYVPETGALFEHLSAKEYLDLVATLHKLNDEEAAARIEKFLRLFSLFENREKRMHTFSKGLRQRVVICAALLSNPEVLLLDEPLEGLDATTALIVKDLLTELATQGRTILMCTHVLEMVERMCQRLVIINGGKLIVDGTADEIISLARADSLESAFAILTGTRNRSRVTAGILDALK
ncbi:MAG: ABC transporter ATP-binding protein [Gammaproteobacteria bacterium]|nr:ABC transporter ATP-binding protein [Gammaproteobacteria bacterium]